MQQSPFLSKNVLSLNNRLIQYNRICDVEVKVENESHYFDMIVKLGYIL